MSHRDLKRLGEAVKDRRGELGLTQTQFADRAGVDPEGQATLSVKQLQRIEAGKVTPRAKTLGALDRAAEWLTGSARRVLEGRGEPIPASQHDLVRSAINSIRDHILAGVDTTTYNQHLDKWARILASRNPDVSIDEVRQEASRQAAEILANRRSDNNPASATG